MKIAAVTVLYVHSQEELPLLLANMETYKNYVENIFLVDNSAHDNSNFFNNLNKFTYIYNGNKNGIAGALNAGCEKALENNFDCVLTMDQDSSFSEDQIKNYITTVEENFYNSNYASFSPTIENTTLKREKTLKEKIKILIKKILKRPRITNESYDNNLSAFVFKDMVITSGNIINLEAWKKVDKFDELLFIDCVDFDFCHKLIRNNYKIIRFSNIFMKHSLGSSLLKKTLFKRKTPEESDFRLYYIIRNILIEKYRFNEYRKYYKNQLRNYLFDYLINTKPPFCKIKIILKAYFDFAKLRKSKQIVPYMA